MSADFPAAVGQNRFESLHADSCGSLQGRKKKKKKKINQQLASSITTLHHRMEQTGPLNMKMPPTFHFILCVYLELINGKDISCIGQMEKKQQPNKSNFNVRYRSDIVICTQTMMSNPF